MAWREVNPMDEKVKFISFVLEDSRSFSQVCRAMNVSRKTGYKWINRYNEEGISGLEERSRAPKNCSHRVSERVEKKVVNLRKKYPYWGAPKLHAFLNREGYDDLPAIATVGRILKRNDLIEMKPKKRLKEKTQGQLTQPQKPNDVWAADYKGDFKSRCGTRTYPLTISDLHSRYLLCCKSLRNTSYEDTKKGFTKVFKEYGLPLVIRTDNGVPFTSNRKLSRLMVWWMDLDIRSELIEPGKPHQNGVHERMHKTLKREAINKKEYSFKTQQNAFNEYREVFNNKRPHEGINNQVPSELYQNSPRLMPEKISAPEYPSNFKVVRIDERGNIYHKRRRWFLSHALNNHFVGLQPLDDGLWRVFYRINEIAYLDEKHGQIFQTL